MIYLSHSIVVLFVTSPKKMMRETTTRNLRQSKHPIFPREIPMMSFNPPFFIRENREIPPFFLVFLIPNQWNPTIFPGFSLVFPGFFIPKSSEIPWNPPPRGRCQSRRISVAPPRAWTPTDSGRLNHLHDFMDGLIFDLFGDNYFYVYVYIYICIYMCV